VLDRDAPAHARPDVFVSYPRSVGRWQTCNAPLKPGAKRAQQLATVLVVEDVDSVDLLAQVDAYRELSSSLAVDES
jgi:hypothetical protein